MRPIPKIVRNVLIFVSDLSSQNNNKKYIPIIDSRTPFLIARVHIYICKAPYHSMVMHWNPTENTCFPRLQTLLSTCMPNNIGFKYIYIHILSVKSVFKCFDSFAQLPYDGRVFVGSIRFYLLLFFQWILLVEYAPPPTSVSHNESYIGSLPGAAI